MLPEFRAEISGPETRIVSLAFHYQFGQHSFRTGAEMADDFGGGHCADLAAAVQVHALGNAMQKA